MSTATLTPTSVPGGRGEVATGPLDVSVPRVPMHRLVAVETRKMVDTLSGAWLLGLVLVADLLVVGGLILFGDEPVMGFASQFGLVTLPASFLLPVLAILLVTSEWSQRSALTTFGLEPRRARVVTAKLLTAVVTTAVVLVVSLVVAAGGTLLADIVHGLDDPWSFTTPALVNPAIGLTISLLMAFGFAMALRSSPAAIVLYFVLPTVWTILGAVVPWLRENVQSWADLGAAQEPLMTAQWPTGEQWGDLATASAIWVLLPLVVGVWRLLRSEVK